MKRNKIICILFTALVVLTSCDKGYDVRFANYYTEAMDSVVIGDNKVVFTNVELQKTTDFKKISKGKYILKCISKSKTIFNSTINIPKSGTGKRTIQMDATKSITVLEE